MAISACSMSAPRYGSQITNKVKNYDKRDDLDFDFDVPHLAFYGEYISQLIRFARFCYHVTDVNVRNKYLTAKFLQQGYRYHKLRKTFSRF